MEDFPPPKLPKDFTGQGFEIIGDPTGENAAESQGTLWFQDGNFEAIDFPNPPNSELSAPTTAKESEKHSRRREAERLALHVRKNPTDARAKTALRAIMKACRDDTPRDRAAERAVKSIKQGGNPTHWPAQNRRDRAAIIALIQLCQELHRPPTEAQVIDLMLELHDDDCDMNQRFTQDGSRQHLAKLLRESGFSWLERRPRGYHRDP